MRCVVHRQNSLTAVTGQETPHCLRFVVRCAAFVIFSYCSPALTLPFPTSHRYHVAHVERSLAVELEEAVAAAMSRRSGTLHALYFRYKPQLDLCTITADERNAVYDVPVEGKVLGVFHKIHALYEPSSANR